MKLGARVKEQIARTIGNFFTTNEILNIFTDANISANSELFAKWHITLDAFSKTSGVDAIFGIIEEFCHPLNFTKNPPRREEFITALNAVLAYDDLEIQFTDRTAKVVSSTGEKPKKTSTIPKNEQRKATPEIELNDDEDEIPTINLDDIEPQKDDSEKRKADDNQKIKVGKEKVKKLRDNHQTFLDIVEAFCQNSKKPTKELNDAYLFLAKKIQEIIDELDLQYYELTLYRPFKNDLYTAEMEWNGSGDVFEIRLGQKLSWDAIRPRLYNAHSNIVTIYNISEEDSQMTDDEKRLEEITSLVAEIRTKKDAKTAARKRGLPIEITSLPPIQITREVRTRTASPLTPRNTDDLKVEVSVGDLEAFNDGSIRYKGTPIEMRNQLKDLCRLFMGRPNRLITIDEITEELIRADKRKTTSHTTISKYVSELRAILMSHFKREVFVNQKEEGWFFKP